MPNGTSGEPTRTFGPLSDLERHLPPEWWRSLFNATYLRTDGDVVENEKNTHDDVDLLIRSAGLEPNDRVLDLCCGQGRHALELARRGFKQVTGIDRSRYLVRLARRRAKQANLVVSFREGDARKFRAQQGAYDAVCILGNSFGYFDKEEDDAAVLQAVMRVLRSSGVLAMDLADGAWIRQNFEPRSWEWIDQDQFVCRERTLSQDGARLISREVVVQAERGVMADQFYAERLYTRDTVTDLLHRVGFTDLRFHESPDVESTRGQDLGMLSRRMFLTAKSPPRVMTPAPPDRKPRVTVLLGDPRLPDTVKLGGRFNAEDADTVARLKEALRELDRYDFEYFDNHAELIPAFRDNPPGLVFNLCDEGYGNEALRELHVPAYLEMLELAYTGAGPNCLGLCYDKALVRAIAESLDIAVPLETQYGPDDQIAMIPSVFPALIKPSLGDSSIGITQRSVVHTPEAAIEYLSELRETLPDRPALVQEFLTGPEYTVGIIGNPGIDRYVLPLLEVDYSGLPEGLPPILSYESKWDPSSAYWSDIRYKEAEINPEQRRRLIDSSMILQERLRCRDYCRFDFRADAAGEIKLLEVNPNPGWCWDGKMNLMAGYAGLSYAQFLGMILEAAQARTGKKDLPAPLAMAGGAGA